MTPVPASLRWHSHLPTLGCPLSGTTQNAQSWGQTTLSRTLIQESSLLIFPSVTLLPLVSDPTVCAEPRMKPEQRLGSAPFIPLEPGGACWLPCSFLPEQSASSPSSASVGYRPGAGGPTPPPARSVAGPRPAAQELCHPPGRDDMLDVETDAYIHCVSAFVKLAQSEYQLLADIIPEHHQKKTFDSLIQDALDGLMLEGENIVSAARKAIVRHDFSTVLTVFPILRHLKQTKPEFDQVLQGTAASTKNKLPGLITSMETIGAKALEDFADNIKNDPDKEYNMPKDGTVHELTSNAILFLQQLLDFQETAGAMLASQETSSSATSYSSEFSKRLLSTYICKVLGNLQLNLLSKSKVYEDPALSAIFLHNNYNYILKSLEKSELIQLVAVTQKTAERSYREHIEQQIQTYQRSWLKVTDYIAEKNLPVFQPGVKLRDKERQIIKERFKGFNDGLEELCKIQKAWAIPDTEQRDRIRQAQKTIVKETYGAFLQKFGSVPFTKNPEKYIKYGVEQVGDMIDRLFDTSA
ncbi:exocyst complex component 7, isoform CRA_b [Homo sapiens]|nr:exocyst complex component 7, isoform CRA_b [Homo sapiens]|eukprot:XP_024306442.1 exocyst complex component 7 isoform X9 [Homo sapiens]